VLIFVVVNATDYARGELGAEGWLKVVVVNQNPKGVFRTEV